MLSLSSLVGPTQDVQFWRGRQLGSGKVVQIFVALPDVFQSQREGEQ